MSDKKLPDGPEEPEVFQSYNWLVRPLEYLEECVDKYGYMFTMRLLGFSPMVFIGNSQGVQEIFSTYSKYFHVESSNAVLRPILGDKSVALTDASKHKKERKLLMPAFHGDRLKLYAQEICEITNNITSKWEKNKPFSMKSVNKEIIIKILIDIVFGFTEGKKKKEFTSAITDWIDIIDAPLQSSLLLFQPLQIDMGEWSPWGNLVNIKKRVHELLETEIKYRRNHKEKLGDDMFSFMLEATYEDGQGMSDKRIKHELMTFLYAGYETTTTATTWAFYWLEKYPTVKRKLLQEINALGENPDPMEISRLPYLTAICQETLRIYPTPPFAFGRTAKKNMTIMGRYFEAGTTFYPSIYSVHHQKDLYPNPKQFRPERFLERQYNSYEFIPFGGGSRFCLGYALAMLEMKLVIASVTSKYKLKLADDQPIKPIRHFSAITPSRGVTLVMTGLR